MPNVILFPSDPLNDRRVDPEFQTEWDALQFADVKRALIDQDALANSGEVRTRMLPDTGLVLYRGWMLSLDAYASLDKALTERGLRLVISPLSYWRSHHINAWYGAFHTITARTNWVAPGSSDDDIRATAALTDANAFVIKDYVKSRKHEWDTAAYAPSLDALPDIVREFERLQDDYLVGNIVIREYLVLDKTKPEYRIWWTNGGERYLVSVHPDYVPERHNPADINSDWLTDVLMPLVQKRHLPFMTTDIAIQADGTPILIEVGDGQVSGLPQDHFDSLGDNTYVSLIEQVFTKQ